MSNPLWARNSSSTQPGPKYLTTYWRSHKVGSYAHTCKVDGYSHNTIGLQSKRDCCNCRNNHVKLSSRHGSWNSAATPKYFNNSSQHTVYLLNGIIHTWTNKLGRSDIHLYLDCPCIWFVTSNQSTQTQCLNSKLSEGLDHHHRTYLGE